MRKVNVAISLSFSDQPGMGIWSNGGNQHCVFLYQLLRHSPVAGEVWLVHDDACSSTPSGYMMDGLEDVLRPVSSVIDRTDLFIEMNGVLAPAQAERLRRRHARIVSYQFGNAYVMALENFAFNAHTDWALNPHRIQFDEIWTNAQHEHTCKSFFEVALRAPVHVVPHPWSPHFIERGLARRGVDYRDWGYRNRARTKRIAVFEPNVNVVKSALIPVLAANEFHRRVPGVLEHLYLCCAEQMKDNFAFNRLVHGLEVVRDGKATATGRFPFFQFAANFTDIVLCHQWENGLNYLYYEALCGGYPLVHNSPFLRDVGYYYEDFDIDAAAWAIERAALTHDTRLDDYRRDAKVFLAKVSVSSPMNVALYTERIRALFERRV